MGRIGRDQVLDYHRRKGMDLRTVERWLAPNLDYEPDEPRPSTGTEPERASAPEPKGALATALKLELRFPASPENAADHARLAVEVAREEYEDVLDFSPGSLEDVDLHIESLREEGMGGEDVAEVLFVFGCYLGEVMVRNLGGQWAATALSLPARDLALAHGRGPADGSTWDPDRQGLHAPRARRHRIPARLLRDGRGGTRRPRTRLMETGDGGAVAGAFVIPLTGELDLHTFAPRDIPSVVEEYVRACRERNVLALRLVHGRGRACSARWCAACSRASTAVLELRTTRRRARAVGAPLSSGSLREPGRDTGRSCAGNHPDVRAHFKVVRGGRASCAR